MSDTALSRDEKSMDDQDSDHVEQYLTFVISNESYGIGILHIKEIIEYGNITPVPMVPDFIAGVINLRGSVVPVVNMANRFQVPPSPIGKKTSVIVIEVDEVDSEEDTAGRMEIGIMVDMVNEVLELHSDMILPPPRFGAKIRADFIEAMGKVDEEQFMVLLDINQVLSIEELSLVHSIATDSGSAQEELSGESGL